jgi:Skp family chaperone for outer membrane proteins
MQIYLPHALDSSLSLAGTVVNFVVSGVSLDPLGDNSNNLVRIPCNEFQRRAESMNRLTVRILFAAVLMTSFVMMQTAAQAAQASTITPAKIAWINLDQVILTCDEGAKMFGEIQNFVDAKTNEMDVLRKELDTLRNQLSMQGSKLKEEARAELEEQIESKDVGLQRFQQDTQKDINAKRDRATNALGKKLLPVIEKIAKEKGLQAVQILNSSRDAWIDPALIITEDVIKAYNQTYPAAASKAPAAPAPSKKP